MAKIRIIKTIDVNAYEWFDKINGNSYFSAKVVIDYALPTYREFRVHFQYGYGEQYLYAALKEIKKAYPRNKKIQSCDHFWQLRNLGIILRTNKRTGCKKRDLLDI